VVRRATVAARALIFDIEEETTMSKSHWEVQLLNISLKSLESADADR
jgi:hypothetical protein